MAVLYNVHVIAFEYLDFEGKIKGRKKQRLALWKKQYIQQMVEHKAHLNLMRVSRICAWGTSSLAFDGSGYIFRGRIGLTFSELEDLIQGSKKEGRPETYCNQERCTFRNGKEYACDLSASYNIGARYFLRAFCYEHPELQAQLPKASKRTYSDLKTLNPCW